MRCTNNFRFNFIWRQFFSFRLEHSPCASSIATCEILHLTTGPNRPNFMCWLLKALYGLNKAPIQWYANFNSCLVDDFGFTFCSYEACICYKNNDEIMAPINLYIDDILILSSNRTALDEIKYKLRSRSKMQGFGVPRNDNSTRSIQ